MTSEKYKNSTVHSTTAAFNNELKGSVADISVPELQGHDLTGRLGNRGILRMACTVLKLWLILFR